MTRGFINPGSGDVPDADAENATHNMHQLIADIKVPGTIFTPLPEEDGGRFTYLVRCQDRAYEVNMPGIPLEKVRFTGKKEQNIWHYPRLTVDGSTWVWMYAVNILRGLLTDPDD